MNQPWIYMCSPSRSPLPPPSPPDPSGSSQCTSPEHSSHASNLGWWSVSPLIIYLFQCCSLWTPHPHLLPQSLNVCSVHLCLFFVHRVFQARILEWVTISFSRGSFQPRDQTYLFCISRQILYLWAIWEAHSNVQMSKIQSTGLTECWGGREAAETLVHCWQGCNVVQPLLIKADMELPYNSAATPLRSCRNRGKTYVPIKTCSAMFLAVLLYFFYCPIVNYIVVLVSGVQKNDSVIHTYTYIFFFVSFSS